MSAWVKAANDEPGKELVPNRNNQRDIPFRRLRLGVDPYSQASHDKDFKSAFTNDPLQAWAGGVVALSRELLSPNVGNPSPCLGGAIGGFCKLYSVWNSMRLDALIRNNPFVKGMGTGCTGIVKRMIMTSWASGRNCVTSEVAVACCPYQRSVILINSRVPGPEYRIVPVGLE